MKRILRITILLVLAAILAAGLLYAYGGSGGKKLSYETEASSGMIEVSWDMKWGVRHYDIYRLDVTGQIYTTDYLAFEDYEKIGSVSGLHSSFKDKHVENGHYYAYVIRGFSKNKVICDSYTENLLQYECAGLAKPDLGNNGYGENNENGPECIYLYVQIDGGMHPDGVEVYRRAVGADKFTKVDPGNANGRNGDDVDAFEIKDTTVVPGTVYDYKVRTFAEDGDDRVVSSYSETVTIPAVNFIGQFKVSKMKTEPETCKLRLTIKSDPYNGKLELNKGAPASLTVKDEKGKTKTYALALDNEMLVAAGETAELVFTCTGKTLPEIEKPSGTLVVGVESEGVTYEMGVFGWTELTFDLDKGTGTVFVDWDN